MSKLSRTFAVAALAAAMTVGAGTAGNAAVTYPGGGVWDSGADCCSVWSDYNHNWKTHKASVEGDNFETSGWKAPTVMAMAEQSTKLYGNKAWWNTQY